MSKPRKSAGVPAPLVEVQHAQQPSNVQRQDQPKSSAVAASGLPSSKRQKSAGGGAVPAGVTSLSVGDAAAAAAAAATTTAAGGGGLSVGSRRPRSLAALDAADGDDHKESDVGGIPIHRQAEVDAQHAAAAAIDEATLGLVPSPCKWSQAELERKLRTELLQLCIDEGIKIRKSSKKDEFISALLSGKQLRLSRVKSDPDAALIERFKAAALFSTSKIKEEHKKLVDIVARVHPGPSRTQVHDLLARVGAGISSLEQRNIVLGFVGNRGSGKSYVINTLLMTGCAWATCKPSECKTRCTDDRPCLGHSGPLPSMVFEGSLTAVPIRTMWSARLTAVLKKTGDLVHEQKEFPMLDAKSMVGVRQQITDWTSTIQGWSPVVRAQCCIEVRGPFPGLATLEADVKRRLDDADKPLFAGVALLDTPGYEDKNFSQASRREVLQGCDLVLFRCSNSAGRGASTSDVLHAIEAGALPSFVDRATLVLLHNLERDEVAGEKQQPFDVCRNNYLKLLRDQFELLNPKLDEDDEEQADTDTDDEDKQADVDMSDANAAAATAAAAQDAAAAAAAKGIDTAVAKDRAALDSFLCNPRLVVSQSRPEVQALFDAAALECQIFLFSSSGFQGLESPISNLAQLTELVVKEIVNKARISRAFPLLDDLQNVSQLIGRRAARLIYQSKTVLPIRQRLQDRFNAIKNLLPSLGSVSEVSADMKAILNELECSTGMAAGPSPAYVAGALQDASTVMTLQTPHMQQLLIKEAMRWAEASFRSVLGKLDDAVDAEVKRDGFQPEVAGLGFYRYPNEKQLKQLLQELPKKLDMAKAVATFKGMNKDTQKLRTKIQKLLQEHTAAADNEDDEPGAADDDSESGTDDELARARRQKFLVNVYIILSLALQRDAVNHRGGNSMAGFPVADFLRELGATLAKTCAEGVHQQLDVHNSGNNQVPLPDPKEAKQLADAADDCKDKIRTAMRHFNPSWCPPDAPHLWSDDPIKPPVLFVSSAGEEEEDQKKKASKTPLCQLRFTTKDLLYAESSKQNKGQYKLSEVVKAIDMRALKPYVIRAMVAHKLMERAQSPATVPDGATKQAKKQKKKKQVVNLPKDKDNGAQRFAAALVKAIRACDTLPPSVFEHLPPQPVEEDVPADLLQAASDLVFGLRKSSVVCQLVEDEELQRRVEQRDPNAPIGDASAVSELVEHALKGDNHVIHVTQNAAKEGFEARMLPSLGKILRTAASPDAAAQYGNVDPIFIPSRRCGGDQYARGNLFLDANSLSERASPADKVNQGLEDKPALLFVVVEPRFLLQFLQTYGSRSQLAAEHMHATLVWVVLPINFAFFGYAVTIGKLLAEALSFPRYWTIDDDLDFVEQFDNPGRWYKASFRRCLQFGQAVLDKELKEKFLTLDANSRAQNVTGPAAALIKSRVRELQDVDPFDVMGVLIGLANTVVATAHERFDKRLVINPRACLKLALEAQLSATPDAVATLRHLSVNAILDETLELLETKLKEHGRGGVHLIAGVSISHVAAKRSGYVNKKPRNANYRPSEQRYQFVLHNTDAVRGHNMVPDSTLLGSKPWHTMTQRPPKGTEQGDAFDDWRRTLISGCKGPDKIFTRMLSALGKTGFQIYSFAHTKLLFPNEDNKLAWELTASEGASATAAAAAAAAATADEDEEDSDNDSVISIHIGAASP